MRAMRWTLAIALGASALGAVGCSKKPRITGGGSSFVDPMMRKWATEYKAQKGTIVDYTSSGSGDGIKQMIEGKNLFGCTDAPMTEEQMKSAGGPEAVVHVPLVMGAVVPIYNLAEVKDQPLKFTGEVLAKIFLGEIKEWDDKELQGLNEGVKLPKKKIQVVHRSDGSGTSHIFTDFLSKTSAAWKDKVGTSTNPTWPVGQGEVKNPGVAGAVSSTPGAIGYVELIYALQNKELKVGKVKNAVGEYVDASLESVTAAADASLKTIPDDLRFSIVNPKAKGTYPISGTVWAVAKIQQSGDNGLMLANFLRWCVNDGQNFAAELHYARLPKGLVERAEKKIALIK
jgi:phosphate transport system substrate-binding protein